MWFVSLYKGPVHLTAITNRPGRLISLMAGFYASGQDLNHSWCVSMCGLCLMTYPLFAFALASHPLPHFLVLCLLVFISLPHFHIKLADVLVHLHLFNSTHFLDCHIARVIMVLVALLKEQPIVFNHIKDQLLILIACNNLTCPCSVRVHFMRNIPTRYLS